MQRDDWTARVIHILEAIAKIDNYTSGMGFSSFVADDRTVDAVLYNFAVIGEAARYIPPDIASRFPDLPVTEMRAMRNVIIHDYSGIDLQIVWDTAQSNLPPVAQQLVQLLGDQGS